MYFCVLSSGCEMSKLPVAKLPVESYLFETIKYDTRVIAYILTCGESLQVSWILVTKVRVKFVGYLANVL